MPTFIITEDNRKFDLSKAENLEISSSEEHGVRLTGVWKTKTGKVIVGTDSLWQKGNSGCSIGQTYHVASDDEIASLAREFDSETLTNMVPEEE
jgi:hypothetical protein